jgi:hypothetical protein
VELRRVIVLLGLLCQGTKVTHSSQNHGCDGSPSLLPRHAGWIDVVDVWARSPLIVSGAFLGSNGEKDEALSTSCTIPGVGSERPFWFSPTVQIARCRIAHLAHLIFSELGQKLPFLAANLEACFAPLPVMTSGGDHGKHACGGSPRRDCCCPIKQG